MRLRIVIALLIIQTGCSKNTPHIDPTGMTLYDAICETRLLAEKTTGDNTIVYKARAQRKNNNTVFVIERLSRNKLLKYQIDGNTGHIIQSETKNKKHNYRTYSESDLAKAVLMVEENSNDLVCQAEVKLKNNTLVYEIKTINKNESIKVSDRDIRSYNSKNRHSADICQDNHDTYETNRRLRDNMILSQNEAKNRLSYKESQQVIEAAQEEIIYGDVSRQGLEKIRSIENSITAADRQRYYIVRGLYSYWLAQRASVDINEMREYLEMTKTDFSRAKKTENTQAQQICREAWTAGAKLIWENAP